VLGRKLRKGRRKIINLNMMGKKEDKKGKRKKE
jgi:hypothetical protein